MGTLYVRRAMWARLGSLREKRPRERIDNARTLCSFSARVFSCFLNIRRPRPNTTCGGGMHDARTAMG